jgi:hypothetical protein
VLLDFLPASKSFLPLEVALELRDGLSLLLLAEPPFLSTETRFFATLTPYPVYLPFLFYVSKTTGISSSRVIFS